MRIIINADDFGISKEVNAAINQAFNYGLINSTTLLANMDGFDDACRLAQNSVLKEKIGVHLNLFEGKPLTNEMQRSRIFCNENGEFHSKKIHFYDPIKMKPSIIYNELFAQINRLIEVGIIPTHIDSHAHRHTNFLIIFQVIKLSKYFKIPSIRISHNIGLLSVSEKVKRLIFRYLLKIYGIKTTDYFSFISDDFSDFDKMESTIELGVHLTLKNDVIIETENNESFIQIISPFLKYEQISFSQL
jgi:hypothetical protein